MIEHQPFSDIATKFICSTWEEAIENKGLPFDSIVLVSGMAGAYAADKIYRRGNTRVVLEAGPLFLIDHIQNLPNLGIKTPTPIAVPTMDKDPGLREHVWGIPWRSKISFAGQAYNVGGKSLFWAGWAPRLTDDDLKNWPEEIVNYLYESGKTLAGYEAVEKEIGAYDTTDFYASALQKEFKKKLETIFRNRVPTMDKVEDAPIAVQGKLGNSSLFGFQKYTSIRLLIEALRQEASASPDYRRLFVVPRAHILKLNVVNGAVSSIDVSYDGQLKVIPLASYCKVVLALGTIENTRLALDSFPTSLMGKNLMTQMRINTMVRIKRSSLLPKLPWKLDTATFLIRGSTTQARYHLQVVVVALEKNNHEHILYKMVPDATLNDNTLSLENPDWILVNVTGMGEMKGNKKAEFINLRDSWINMSSDQVDEFGMKRCWVNLATSPQDDTLWDIMDVAALELVKKISDNNPENIQYYYKKDYINEAWHLDPPPPSMSENYLVRDYLTATHGEGGTLWLGRDPKESVTDVNGKFHHISNCYVVGPAVFPTMGSANPTLTALALARKTALHIAKNNPFKCEPDFKLLFEGSLVDWKMLGAGKFHVIGTVLETEGGPGILWYYKEQFSDFILRLDWKVNLLTDDSGIYLRMPALDHHDTNWQSKADTGWEVQIDERGFDTLNNTERNKDKTTGSVYNVSPALKNRVSRNLGEWNSFEIIAKGFELSVLLNGVLINKIIHNSGRMLQGFIGLQNHHAGSKVQFANIRIKKI